MRTVAVRFVKCPVCRSTDHDSVYERDFRVWSRDRLFVWPAQQVVCKRCGMIFTNPQPTSATLKDFYESDLAYQSDDDSSRYFRHQQLEFIRSHASKDCRSVFDIGASNGAFLDIAKSKGYVVTGVEPSSAGVQEAERKFGIRMAEGFFDRKFVGSCKDRYDIVTIRHVLEHIRNPVPFLRLATKITARGKYIFIEVPDASRPFAENIADFFSHQHILHYTEGSLRNIASQLRLPIVAVQKLEEVPIIRLLLKNEYGQRLPLKNEHRTNVKVVKAYKLRRTEFIRSLRTRIDPGTKKLILYGAGMHTTQLLQTGLLEDIEIDCIVDSNAQKHGTVFEGFEVQSPRILEGRRTPVLISSYDSQDDISRYLTANFPHVPQIRLYDSVISYDRGKRSRA